MAESQLVGRSDSIEQLDQVLGQATGGTFAVAAITGEPGAGKTSLLAELGRLASQRRCMSVQVACQQHAAVPLLPLAALVKALIDGFELTEPERHGLEPIIDPLGAAVVIDPDRARLATALALDSVVRRRADDRPVVIMIDDLQWADRGTLESIAQLVSTLTSRVVGAPLRVLIGFTMLDDSTFGELERRLLDQIVSSPVTRTLVLGRLDRLESHDLMAATASSRRAHHEVVTALQAVAGGLPLMVVEAVRSGLANGALVVRDGTLTESRPGVARTLAPTPDETYMRRMATLDRREIDVLRALAVVGGPLGVSILGKVAGVAEVEAALGLLVDDAFVTARAGEVSFTHPTVRTAVLVAIDEDTIAELHHRAGVVLATEPEAQLRTAAAYHLRLSGRADRAELGQLSDEAAVRAERSGAWGEAADLLEVSLPTASPDHLAGLHLRVGRARARNVEPTEARQHLSKALDLARSTGDHLTWGGATLELLAVRITQDVGAPGRSVDRSAAIEFLNSVDDVPTVLKAQIERRLADAAFTQFDGVGGFEHAQRALALAEEVGSQEILAEVWVTLGLQHLGVLDLDKASAAYQGAHQHAQAAGDRRLETVAETRLAMIDMAHGRVRSARGRAHTAAEVQRESGFWSELAMSLAIETAALAVSADHADAERLAQSAAEMVDRTDNGFAAAIYLPAIASARALRGDHGGANEALDRLHSMGTRGVWRGEMLILGFAGELTELGGRLSDRRWTPVDGETTFVSASPSVMGIEVGLLADDADLMRDGLEAACHLRELGVMMTPGWPLFVPRLEAVALAAHGDEPGARKAFSRARAAAIMAGLAIEVGRIDLDMVELGLDDDDDTAVRAAERLDGQGALALSLRAHRHAAQTELSRPIRTVLVADLVGSTAMNTELGNVAFHAVVREMIVLLRSALAETGGVEFKHTGDGLCAWYSSAPAAVRGAERMHEALRLHNESHGGPPLAVRVGMAAGQPVPDRGDLFGIEVARAARLCDRAATGGTLVSAEVVDMVGPSEAVFGVTDDLDLKGIPGKISAYRIEKVG